MDIAADGAPLLEEGLTYEVIVEGVLDLLRRREALPVGGPSIPWNAFVRLSDLVHERFEIPATTITPVMRRLLFGLGFAARSRHLVGVGTYVGYTWSWLLRDRADGEAGPFLESALGIDLNLEANRLAARNCTWLGHGERVAFVDGDGAETLQARDGPIDLLYLDIDDERTGKAGYLDVLSAAAPHLLPGALVLAHDPCVARFKQDFATYHQFVRESGRFAGVWILPVDPCGLSVALAW